MQDTVSRKVLKTASPAPAREPLGRWFAGLRIQGKLACAFGVLLALVAAVAAAGLLGLASVQSSFQSAIDKGLHIERLAEEMNRELLEARRAEKDFLLGWPREGYQTANRKYVTVNADHLGRIRRIVSGLEAAAGSGAGASRQRITEDLVALKPYVDEYAGDFQEAVGFIGAHGARNPALEARFEEAAMVVEPLVADISLSGRQEAAAEIAAARAAGRRTVVMVGLSFAAAIAAGLGLAYALGHRIRTPLQNLARVAEAVGGGNLSVQAQAFSQDEIGTLANAFNAMTGRLRDLIASLEQRVQERKLAEEALRASQRLLQSVMDNSTAVICVKDLQGRYILVNRRFEELFHVRRLMMLGKNDFDLFPKEFAETFRANDRKALEQARAVESEETAPQDDGVHTYLSVKFPLRDEAGGAYAVCSISTDITERMHVEEQLRQSQKMEAIGRLAGGVAHDFNNLLTAINGYSSIALQSLDGSHPLYDFLREIHKSGERAAGLTRQLLAYSRKQMVEMKVLNLNTIVSDIEGMLMRLIGEDVRMTTSMSPDLWFIRADRGQVEQVLLNLAVNARDAMPKGGSLRIETCNAVLELTPSALPSDPSPGPHVMLSVADTGSGMTAEVMGRIFEPFFTTKSLGQGTGLGLSVVYGIAKHNGGGITVHSEPGRGSVFRIYFPKAETGDEPQAPQPELEPGSYQGSETVLLVEDEESVRRFAGDALATQGYKVLLAGHGGEALRFLEDPEYDVQLVITDVVMPDMGGRELAERIRRDHPHLPVLFVSGYSELALNSSEAPDAEVSLLQKPFGPSDLARKVRELLDGVKKA